MNEQQREVIRGQIRASLRRHALESVRQKETQEEIFKTIAAENAVPEDTELRELLTDTGRGVILDLERAYRRSAATSFWQRFGHTRIVIIPLLVLLLTVGALLRFDRISQPSEWIDEYWAVHLATGRSRSIIDLPKNQILQPVPSNFVGAPPWSHVWTGLSSVTHPPLYYLALRWWIDLFGDSDFADRAMSLCFALGSIVVIFDAVRRSSGSTAQALCAAALLTLVPYHIYFSQEIRPYTMLIFFGLLVADLVIVIQTTGPTLLKASLLFLATFCFVMTHYFSAGVFTAIGIYALIRLRSRSRWTVVAAMVSAVVVFAIAWAPMFLRSQHTLAAAYHELSRPGPNWREAIIALPSRLMFDNGVAIESGIGMGFWVVAALAIVLYILPLLRLKRHPDLLLWWLWVVCELICLLILDLSHHTHFASMTKYFVLAAPGVLAIYAAPLPTRLGWFLPILLLITAAGGAFTRLQEGPMKTRDIRLIAEKLSKAAQPGDVVVINDITDMNTPSFTYIAIGHYLHDWKNPVVLVTKPINAELSEKIMSYPHVWVLGSIQPALMPGWKLNPVANTEDAYLSQAK